MPDVAGHPHGWISNRSTSLGPSYTLVAACISSAIELRSRRSWSVRRKLKLCNAMQGNESPSGTTRRSPAPPSRPRGDDRQPLGRGYQLRPVGVPSHLLPPPRGRPPPLGDCCCPRGQGALRSRSPWGWRRKRPPTRSRSPSSMSRADGVPSRPRSRRSPASYRGGGRRLVPAEPLRPREGTRWRKRGAGASPGALAPRLCEAVC